MGIKPDKWMRRMVQQHGMIEPFESGQIRDSGQGRDISYGIFRDDARCSDEFRIFTNIIQQSLVRKRSIRTVLSL
jgi:dCTP deaminase